MQTRTTAAQAQPPKHTQFQKGKSGNPRGRPKGARNLSALLKEALDEPIEQDGQRMTKLEAAAKQIADNAAAGNPRILQMLLTELRRLEAPSAVTPGEDFEVVTREDMRKAREDYYEKMSKLRQELYKSPNRQCPTCGGVAHGPREDPLFWEKSK
jgi:hypothetical protein